MKITEVKPYTPTKIGRARGKSDGESFDVHLNTPTVEEVQRATASQAPEALSQLMQVQEIGEQTISRKKAINHGENLLNDLNRLQADMLGGTMSEQALEKIVQDIKQAPRRNDDPELQEIIDRIHQRAQIELTKIAVTRRG